MCQRSADILFDGPLRNAERLRDLARAHLLITAQQEYRALSFRQFRQCGLGSRKPLAPDQVLFGRDFVFESSRRVRTALEFDNRSCSCAASAIPQMVGGRLENISFDIVLMGKLSALTEARQHLLRRILRLAAIFEAAPEKGDNRRSIAGYPIDRAHRTCLVRPFRCDWNSTIHDPYNAAPLKLRTMSPLKTLACCGAPQYRFMHDQSGWAYAITTGRPRIVVE